MSDTIVRDSDMLTSLSWNRERDSVWGGMARYGMAWLGTGWLGTGWHGSVQDGMARYEADWLGGKIGRLVTRRLMAPSPALPLAMWKSPWAKH